MKWNAEDTMSWLRRDHSASKEDYMVAWDLSFLRCTDYPITCTSALQLICDCHLCIRRTAWST